MAGAPNLALNPKTAARSSPGRKEGTKEEGARIPAAKRNSANSPDRDAMAAAAVSVTAFPPRLPAFGVIDPGDTFERLHHMGRPNLHIHTG